MTSPSVAEQEGLSARAELKRAIVDLEGTLRRAAELSIEQRLAMVQMRRLLYAHYAEIGRLGHAVFNGPGGSPGFSRELSKVRMAIATFQSAWPVVSADARDPEYTKSLTAAREANRDFIAWIRRELEPR